MNFELKLKVGADKIQKIKQHDVWRAENSVIKNTLI